MYAMAYSIPMKTYVYLTDKTAAEVAKLAKVFGESNDQCAERLLTRFVFDCSNFGDSIAEEVEQIVCRNPRQATAMAKRLERFADENAKNDLMERPVRASSHRYDDGSWGVKVS